MPEEVLKTNGESCSHLHFLHISPIKWAIQIYGEDQSLERLKRWSSM